MIERDEKKPRFRLEDSVERKDRKVIPVRVVLSKKQHNENNNAASNHPTDHLFSSLSPVNTVPT